MQQEVNEKNIPKALVTKSNNLVEARYHFSIWETRVFTKLVSLIQPGDADFKKYKLRIKDMINFFGVNDNRAYVKIKAVPDNLLKKVVTIPYTDDKGEERFLKTGLIAQATIPKKKEGYIELSFHPDLKPYLLQLKRKFLSYDIRNVLKISSVYSIRIYELLKQYEKIGHREFEIATLKVILGISNKYKMYGHFKKRIIKKAQKDLKLHTDICFTFEERKQGRKVVAVIFNISKNIPEDKSLDSVEEVAVSQKSAIEDLLSKWNISAKSIKRYFDNYSMDYLATRVRYVINQQEQKKRKGEKIDNLAAYFRSIVDKKDLVDYLQVAKQKKLFQQENSKKKTAQKKQLEKKIKQLKRALDAKEQAFILNLFENEASFKEEMLEQVKRSAPARYANVKDLDQYFEKNPLFRAAVFTAVKKQHAKSFESIKKEFNQSIEQLQQQLQQL